MEKLNLQRTLDSREQDIDVLEKDVFECREIIYSQMEKLRLAEEKEKSTEAELKSREVENMELRVGITCKVVYSWVKVFMVDHAFRVSRECQPQNPEF